MFPPRATGTPEASSMAAAREQVVDLPLVPVTPITGPASSRSVIPISVTMRAPAARARSTRG